MKKILRVPYTVALQCLAPIDGKLPTHVLKAGSIPAGAGVLDVHPNYQTRTLDFVLQHPTFPRHSPGLVLPEIPTVWITAKTRSEEDDATFADALLHAMDRKGLRQGNGMPGTNFSPTWDQMIECVRVARKICAGVDKVDGVIIPGKRSEDRR